MALVKKLKRGQSVLLEDGTSIFCVDVRGSHATLRIELADGSSTLISVDDPSLDWPPLAAPVPAESLTNAAGQG